MTIERNKPLVKHLIVFKTDDHGQPEDFRYIPIKNHYQVVADIINHFYTREEIVSYLLSLPPEKQIYPLTTLIENLLTSFQYFITTDDPDDFYIPQEAFIDWKDVKYKI